MVGVFYFPRLGCSPSIVRLSGASHLYSGKDGSHWAKMCNSRAGPSQQAATYYYRNENGHPYDPPGDAVVICVPATVGETETVSHQLHPQTRCLGRSVHLCADLLHGLVEQTCPLHRPHTPSICSSHPGLNTMALHVEASVPSKSIGQVANGEGTVCGQGLTLAGQ
jgi:hypothetical protein